MSTELHRLAHVGRCGFVRRYEASSRDWHTRFWLSPSKFSRVTEPHPFRVLYLRSPGEMLVTPGEFEELEREGGGRLDFLVAPVAFVPDADGRVRDAVRSNRARYAGSGPAPPSNTRSRSRLLRPITATGH